MPNTIHLFRRDVNRRAHWNNTVALPLASTDSRPGLTPRGQVLRIYLHARDSGSVFSENRKTLRLP